MSLRHPSPLLGKIIFTQIVMQIGLATARAGDFEGAGLDAVSTQPSHEESKGTFQMIAGPQPQIQPAPIRKEIPNAQSQSPAGIQVGPSVALPIAQIPVGLPVGLPMGQIPSGFGVPSAGFVVRVIGPGVRMGSGVRRRVDALPNSVYSVSNKSINRRIGAVSGTDSESLEDPEVQDPVVDPNSVPKEMTFDAGPKPSASPKEKLPPRVPDSGSSVKKVPQEQKFEPNITL